MIKLNKKILLVEDDMFLSKIMEERLQDEGWEVNLAGNGEEGLQKAKSYLPDLILLDMILPKMNGFEVLEALKKDEKTKKIPVIVLSNLGQDEDIKNAKKIGAADYLVKSNFSIKAIVEKINKIFSRQ
jgi:DNA-binding response OmpR family regulator